MNMEFHVCDECEHLQARFKGEATPKVSVLMPVYNEARFIENALASVLSQRTSFEVEILVIDDGSTDSTPEIVQRISQSHPSVRMIRNAVNSGKGISVSVGYRESRGEYFQILDGDDFFTFRDKLQRQVEFLDEHRGYFAIGHNSLVTSRDGVRMLSGGIEEATWSNELCLSGRVYSHTSSLLFRKQVRELPEYFTEPEFRGDTALFFFHAYLSRQACKYLPGVWSVYNYHGSGLWSGMSAKKKKEMNLAIVGALQDKVVPESDSQTQAILAERTQTLADTPESREAAALVPPNELLRFARRASSAVFEHREDAFKAMHAFELVDNVCESLGCSMKFELGLHKLDRDFDESVAIIILSGLVPGGGGIFREILEFVRLLNQSGHTVGVISTQSIPTEKRLFEEYFAGPKVWHWLPDEEMGLAQRLESTLMQLEKHRPGLLLPFITHNDAVGCAAIQHGMAGSIVLDYVYDHGLSMAATNSSIDTVIVKTVSQAKALQSMLAGPEFCLLPPFMEDHDANYADEYLALQNGALTTASAAARSYKVEGDYRYSYAELVPHILLRTGGSHVHYGPLSDEALDAICSGMDAYGIPQHRFSHIAWTNQFGKSLVDDRIDLFIAPFPVCSARIAVEVSAVGIPSAHHHLQGSGIPQSIEFTDPNQFVWRTPDELLTLLEGLSADLLTQKSASARAFFESNNELSVASEKLFTPRRLYLNPNIPPDFYISEFSKKFHVAVDTRAFGGRTVFSPGNLKSDTADATRED